MRVPRIDPVGVARYPRGYVRSSRASLRVRWLAWVLLAAFAIVSVATTIASVGEYCLTSDGGDVSSLPRR